MKLQTKILAGLLPLVLAAPAAMAQSGPNAVLLSLENLSITNLEFDGHYEAWARIGGELVSLGQFNINEFGEPVDTETDSTIAEFDAGTDVSTATEILVSVEPPEDVDPASSGVYILRGDVSDHSAELATQIAGVDQLENDATAEFVLATPSDDDSMPLNDDHGIWFLTQPGPDAGLLNLPDLGSDWHYEGWVVDISDTLDPQYHSTGTFTSGVGFDSDQAGPQGGGPEYPGQDFVDYQGGPVLDLDSGNFAVMVTIEPTLDNATDRPFMLTVFRDGIATDALGRNNTVLNQVALFPQGTASLYNQVPVEASTLSEIKALFD